MAQTAARHVDAHRRQSDDRRRDHAQEPAPRWSSPEKATARPTSSPLTTKGGSSRRTAARLAGEDGAGVAERDLARVLFLQSRLHADRRSSATMTTTSTRRGSRSHSTTGRRMAATRPTCLPRANRRPRRRVRAMRRLAVINALTTTVLIVDGRSGVRKDALWRGLRHSHISNRSADPFSSFAGEGGAKRRMGCGPLPQLWVGLHDRHREPSSTHPCFPHPIRPSGPPSPLRGEGGARRLETRRQIGAKFGFPQVSAAVHRSSANSRVLDGWICLEFLGFSRPK